MVDFHFLLQMNIGPRYSVSHLRLWGEEGAGHSVHVLWVDLDAHIVEAHLVEVEWARSRAEIAFAGVCRDRDRVFQVASRQVVTDGTVHIPLDGENHRGISDDREGLLFDCYTFKMQGCFYFSCHSVWFKVIMCWNYDTSHHINLFNVQTGLEIHPTFA